MLVKTSPDHRLLSKHVLAEIAGALGILGRKDEAREVKILRDQLYS
jgi:hypothetical protein